MILRNNVLLSINFAFLWFVILQSRLGKLPLGKQNVKYNYFFVNDLSFFIPYVFGLSDIEENLHGVYKTPTICFEMTPYGNISKSGYKLR